MLKNISWIDYIATISTLIFIYYLFIGIRYYSHEIKNFIRGKQKQNLNPSLKGEQKNNLIVEQDSDERVSFENNSDEQNTETEQLTERLKSVIGYAMDRRLIPQEFRQYLKMVLKEYPSIRYSPLRSSINELIISESRKYGVAILNEDEVDRLWKEGM